VAVAASALSFGLGLYGRFRSVLCAMLLIEFMPLHSPANHWLTRSIREPRFVVNCISGDEVQLSAILLALCFCLMFLVCSVQIFAKKAVGFIVRRTPAKPSVRRCSYGFRPCSDLRQIAA
jgi:hypothetical protein